MTTEQHSQLILTPVARYIAERGLNATLADYSITRIELDPELGTAWRVRGPKLDGWGIHVRGSWYNQATVYHRGTTPAVCCNDDVERVARELRDHFRQNPKRERYVNPDQNRLFE